MQLDKPHPMWKKTQTCFKCPKCRQGVYNKQEYDEENPYGGNEQGIFNCPHCNESLEVTREIKVTYRAVPLLQSQTWIRIHGSKS